jgi:hypothetical protein
VFSALGARGDSGGMAHCSVGEERRARNERRAGFLAEACANVHKLFAQANVAGEELKGKAKATPGVRAHSSCAHHHRGAPHAEALSLGIKRVWFAWASACTSRATPPAGCTIGRVRMQTRARARV